MSLTDGTTEYTAGSPEDQQALRDLVTLYCRGVDRLDIELLRSIYAPDAQMGFSYSEETFEASWLFESLAKSMDRYDKFQHHVTNSFFRFCGERAEGETYVIAVHTLRAPASGAYVAGARYIDRFRRVRGAWKISYRMSHVDWGFTFDGGVIEPKIVNAVDDPGGSDTRMTGSGLAAGTRDIDPSYRLLEMFKSVHRPGQVWS